jgi:hypothetical protein
MRTNTVQHRVCVSVDVWGRAEWKWSILTVLRTSVALVFRKTLRLGSKGAHTSCKMATRQEDTNKHLTQSYKCYLPVCVCTGRFMMFSVITNFYNKKTKGPTLMELFTAPQENWKGFLATRDVRCVHHGWHGTHWYDIEVLATHASTVCVWKAQEYRIDVCRVTRGAHIEHL